MKQGALAEHGLLTKQDDTITGPAVLFWAPTFLILGKCILGTQILMLGLADILENLI